MIQPPLSLYIHIPWCVKKCPYCDFNSHEATGEHVLALPEKEYLQALVRDAKSERTLIDPTREIVSVFIGGGTPSLMSGDFYIELFSSLGAIFKFANDAEITLEANPGAIDAAHFTGFIDAGINRLSIGAQSFSNDSLQRLGRIHSADNIYRAFDIARNAGFNNINIDLMHGLPEQTLTAGLFDLDSAFQLSPEHISWYQLTIEKNTVFYNQTPKLPAENLLDDLFLKGQQRLAAEGYLQYEVSAFARDRQSAHNKNYWQFGDYVGIGAGAHGKLSLGGGDIVRRWKTRTPADYMAAADQLAGSTTVLQDDLPLEFMMNALRLNEGFTAALFNQRTGMSFDVVKRQVIRLQERGLLEQAEDYYRPSVKGRLFLNDVIAAFAD